MIRYGDDITIDELNTRIDEEKSSWRDRADKRTEEFRGVGAYDESIPECGSIWSEIKAVYMMLQHNKCGYCERYLEGKIQHDVEHFRPKKAVKAYRPPNEPQYPFPTGGVWAEGYYLLAYHPQNYLASCKTCNTTFKKSYFPIAGTRQQSDDPQVLLAEEPFLIYPIGTMDSDPEAIIEFYGIIAKSSDHDPSAHNYCRAKVTIDLLNLNKRDTLLKERSTVITALWNALDKYPQDMISKNYIASAQLASAPHCNCARSFCRLYQNDPTWAEQLAEFASIYLSENSS